MELTIKELAAYLPYGLKCKIEVFGDNETIVGLEGLNHNEVELSGVRKTVTEYFQYNEIKPILYSLEYLQDFLSQIYNELKFGSIIIKKMEFATIVKYQLMGETFTDIVYSQGSFNNCPMYVFDKLVEIKLDIFNLIENNLAISVTEEFNPYK